MLFSCHGTIDPETQDPEPGPGPGPDPTPENLELKLTSDRNLIQTNVDAATLTVTLGDEVLTGGVTFYDVDFNEMNIPDFKFKASKAGDYVIVASYGTYISEKITVKAIDIEIPALRLNIKTVPESPVLSQYKFKIYSENENIIITFGSSQRIQKTRLVLYLIYPYTLGFLVCRRVCKPDHSVRTKISGCGRHVGFCRVAESRCGSILPESGRISVTGSASTPRPRSCPKATRTKTNWN